jgi:hypothetical protein
MQRKTLGIVVAVVVLGIGWYLFRPEKLFIDVRVDEGFPEGRAAGAAAAPTAGQILAAGQFHAVAHDGKGKAMIHRLGDGRRVLRLTDFETSNGPELHVYLVAAADATDNATVTSAGFVSLGPLKGNVGDQNYDVPAEVDLSRYQAVTIWCRRFGVNFATAPLGTSRAG